MIDDDRLAEIERKLDRTFYMVETLSQRVADHSEAEKAWNDKLTRTIYGYNGTAGLLVKLDRLEQSQERAKWFLRAIAGVMLGTLATLIAARVI